MGDFVEALVGLALLLIFFGAPAVLGIFMVRRKVRRRKSLYRCQLCGRTVNPSKPFNFWAMVSTALLFGLCCSFLGLAYVGFWLLEKERCPYCANTKLVPLAGEIE